MQWPGSHGIIIQAINNSFNVCMHACIVTVTVCLGIPIISTVSASTLLHFIIVCMFLDTVIYVCLFALFLPSAVPFFKEKLSVATMHCVRAKPVDGF